jgi:hypothetical protein
MGREEYVNVWMGIKSGSVRDLLPSFDGISQRLNPPRARVSQVFSRQETPPARRRSFVTCFERV